jgi:hypothetical protein
MPAYRVALDLRCQQERCPRTATQEVRNTVNAFIGRYCMAHAEQMVTRLNDGCRPEPTSPPAWAQRQREL